MSFVGHIIFLKRKITLQTIGKYYFSLKLDFYVLKYSIDYNNNIIRN